MFGVKAVDILWDYDSDDEIEYNSEELDLPDEVEISYETVEAYMDDAGLSEDELRDYLEGNGKYSDAIEWFDEMVSDYVTDYTGFCHKGFELEMTEQFL